MVATHLSAQCNAGACLSIENIDIDAGTLDVYMTNQAGCGYCTDAGYADPESCENFGNFGQGADWIFDYTMDASACTAADGVFFNGNIGGFQFFMDGIAISNISGGTAGSNLDLVNVTSPSDCDADGNADTGCNLVLGVAFFGGVIPPGTDEKLFTANFTDYNNVSICFAGTEEIQGGSSSWSKSVLSNDAGSEVYVNWGSCYCDGGVAQDACGECGGTNTDCLADGEACISDDQCEIDSCDECGVCGVDDPSEPVCPDGSPKEFQFNQSTLQDPYLFTIVTIDNDPVDSDDWVGAFNGETCVGARKWEISQCGGGICDVIVMGNDGNELTNGYCNNHLSSRFHHYP